MGGSYPHSRLEAQVLPCWNRRNCSWGILLLPHGHGGTLVWQQPVQKCMPGMCLLVGALVCMHVCVHVLHVCIVGWLAGCLAGWMAGWLDEWIGRSHMCAPVLVYETLCWMHRMHRMYVPQTLGGEYFKARLKPLRPSQRIKSQRATRGSPKRMAQEVDELPAQQLLFFAVVFFFAGVFSLFFANMYIYIYIYKYDLFGFPV